MPSDDRGELVGDLRDAPLLDECREAMARNRRDEDRREGIFLDPIPPESEEKRMREEQATLGSGVVSDPSIRGGEPILAGTATPVRAVVELWRLGVPIETIPVQLPHVGLPRVLEAIYYYLGHRDEIDAHIAANRIPEGWSGRRFDPATGRVEP